MIGESKELKGEGDRAESSKAALKENGKTQRRAARLRIGMGNTPDSPAIHSKLAVQVLYVSP